MIPIEINCANSVSKNKHLEIIIFLNLIIRDYIYLRKNNNEAFNIQIRIDINLKIHYICLLLDTGLQGWFIVLGLRKASVNVDSVNRLAGHGQECSLLCLRNLREPVSQDGVRGRSCTDRPLNDICLNAGTISSNACKSPEGLLQQSHVLSWIRQKIR